MKASVEIPGDYQYRALHHGPRMQRFWHRNKIELLRALACVAPTDIVVEVGCGSGNLLLESDLHPRLAVGVDASLPALRFCLSRPTSARVRFVRALGEALPFTSQSVDLVVLIEVIEHLPDPGRVLADITRILRPGGNLIVTTPNYDWPSPWPALEWLADRSRLVAPMRDVQHVRRFGPASLREILEQHRFSVDRLGTMYRLSPFLSLVSQRWAAAAAAREITRGIRAGALVYCRARSPAASRSCMSGHPCP